MVLGGKLGFCGDLGVSTPFLTTCCIKNNNQTFVRKSNITWESANQNHHFETLILIRFSVFCLNVIFMQQGALTLLWPGLTWLGLTLTRTYSDTTYTRTHLTSICQHGLSLTWFLAIFHAGGLYSGLLHTTWHFTFASMGCH